MKKIEVEKNFGQIFPLMNRGDPYVFIKKCGEKIFSTSFFLIGFLFFRKHGIKNLVSEIFTKIGVEKYFSPKNGAVSSPPIPMINLTEAEIYLQ